MGVFTLQKNELKIHLKKQTALLLYLRPGSDLLKLDFHPRQCRIMVKALIWESGDLTIGLGK